MATQYKTPADLRLERAQALQMKRLEPQIRREQNAQEQDILKAYKQAEIDAQIERSKQNFLVRSASTVGDVVGNVITGALKGIEGIVDFGLAVDGALNPLAYLFDYQDATKEFATKDLVGTYIDAPMEDFFKYSYTKDGSVGRTVEDVASGVGQLLPAVAAAYFTGGSSLLALGTTAVSAAGNATEQAYQDGAGRYEGLLYGTASGAMEAATEKLTGGIGIYGKGLLNKVARSTVREGVEAVAKTGVRRVIQNAAGEASEEIIAELANPALKSIYKGKDAFSEYGDPEYWKGVGHAGVVGGLTSVAHGGTTGYLMKQSGAYADAQSVLEELDRIGTKVKNQKVAGTFTAEKAKAADASRLANLRVLENTLKTTNAKQRTEIIERNGLSGLFDADGSLNAEYATALSTESQFNRNAYSENMRGNEKIIAEDLARTNADLGLEGDAVLTVFDGTLTAEEQSKYGKVQRVVEAFNKRSGTDTALILLNPNKNINGNITPDSGRIYLSADNLTDGTWAGTIVHEFTHFAEGTQDHAALVDLLLSDEALTKQAWNRLSNKDYGFDMEAMADIHSRMKESGGKALNFSIKSSLKEGGSVEVDADEAVAYETFVSELGAHLNEEMLGNEAFIDKIIRENGSLGEKILGKIIAFKEALGRIGDPEAQAQHKRLVEAEKLYLDAIEAAGKKYVNGKIVSATDDEEKENTAEGGGKYSFAGPKAKTADKMKLATAQEMLEQGVDSETVRKETGWFRGYDGKWRFEISDFEASLIENPNLEKHTDDGEVYFTGKLSDILDHKELFEAYPELKDINIVIQKTDFGVYGIYQPNSNYITLSIEHFKRATKEYYDYANGGRKAEIERIEATPEYQAYNSFYEMDDAENMDPEEWLRQEKELRDRFFNSDLGKRYYQLMWGKNGFTGEKYEFGWGTGGKETLLHELQHAVQRIEGFASGTSTQNADYSRTAGEIEARDTEARTNLTAEQRKNTRPDIDREDVVFAESSDRSLSIAVSENGKPVVVVNDDITRYASNDKELVKLVKQSIGKLPYVAIGKQKIEFVRDTKKEVTFSRYTQQIRKNAPDVYKDKMRLFNHPSEIILATTNYINEGLKHSRTDDIIDFARGELLVDILGNQYTAEVVIGFTKTGVCELHDVVKMVPTSFKYKARDAVSAISHIGEHSQKRSSLGNSIAQNSDLSTPKAKFSLKSDAEYLRAVESGDMEAAQRMVDEAAETAMPNSLVKGEDGKLLYVYHGSPSKFNEFSYRKMNTNGNAHGRGFYFTEKRSLAEGYETDGGQLLKGFLNIEKPLSEETVTIKKSELLKLVKATCEEEARSMVEGGSYDTVKDAILDTWISNYVMTYGMNLNDAYREVVDIIYSGNDNDVDMIAEITNAGAGHERVLRLTHDLLGYGGTIYTAQDGSHEFVALVSNLFKSAEPVTYDDNGKVIPLSERFDVRRRDLRYSLKNSTDADVDALTEVSEDATVEGEVSEPLAKEYKQYSQKEVKALVNAILSENLSFEQGQATFEKKADVEQEVKKLLDTAALAKTPEEGIGKIADYILGAAHIKGVYADASAEVIRAQKTVDSLSRYIHSLDLSPVMGKLTKEDGKMSKTFWRWNNRKGHETVSLEQLSAELAERGFHVEGKTPEQIFFTMDSAYGKADRLLKKHEREHGGLRAILSEDAYTKAREGIVAKLTEVYRTGGRTSEGMRVIAEREKKLAEREARATEKTKDAMRQVKNAANETLYSQEEARAVIDKILAETLDMGEWRGVLRHGTYTASVQKAFAMLNSAEQGKQWSAAYELAGFLMKRVSLVDQIDAAEAKPYIERLEILKPYIRGIDLSSIKKELYELTGSDSAFRRWHKPKDKGGISVEEFFEAIRKKGFDPDSDTARAMMLIDEEYAGVKDILSEKVELSLEEVLLGDEAEKLKREIAKVVFQSFDESKSFSYANLQKVARSFAAKLEKVTEESRRLRHEKAFYEREYEKYYKGFMKERQLKEDTRGLEAATRKTVELVKDIRNWKAGNFQSAAKHRNSNFEETIGSFARLAINGQLNLSGGRKIFADALTWYAEENELFAGYFDPDVATKMKAIADGRGMYTAIEVKQMADVLQNFKKIVEEYGKIFRNGKRIEARPEADRYQGYIKADEHLNTSFTLYGNKFFREIAEPLSLAESADKYRRDGFFTESMQELRQGLIKKETLELDFRRPIDEFLKKQGARYQKSLSKQLVKVGGIMIPKNNALLLYMTTKDADAHGALNVGGFSIVDGAKKPLHDDKTKQALASDGLVYGRMEAGEDVTMEEAMAAVLSLRSELYDQFSDTDKELIRICEQFFNVDGKKVKHDTDIDVKGYSNVKEGYYVPLSHDGRAEEIGLEVQREGVLNYRFNKSRVKGAKGRLMIRPLTDVLFDQMEDIATYAGLSIPIENFNRLYNLNTSDRHYKPTTIKSMLAQDQRLWSDGLQYFQKLINGIEGGGESLGFISKAFGFLRSGLVRTWLSLNPKVLCTQVSALSASFSRLNPKYVAKSVGMRVGKAEAAEMDKYCRLADLRNQDNSAALAQGVIDDINRFGDIGMKGIGFMDRQMIMRLWNACRLQVQAEQKLAFDSEENKIAAGKLLETVILDTQQNSLITERSAMMRSSNEIFKSFTMFSADAMKVSARFLGAFGRVSTIYRRIKLAKDQGATASQIEALNKEMSMSKKELTGATAAMLTSAIYMAAISLLFKAIYGKLDDEDEPEDYVFDFGADVVASILGGLPIIREIWDFMSNGYEIDNHVLSAVNDILSGVKGVYSLADDVMSGKDVDKSEFGGKIRNLLYAVGQIFGVPLRNVHNVLYGVTRFIDAPTAYQWDDATSPQSYRNDLNKAIEKGDEKMVAMIADLMVEESFGTVDARSREAIKSLIGKGYDVLPRSVGDSVVYDGEVYEFTARSRKRFEEVYGVADVAVKDLVSMSKFSSADAAVQAKAIRFIYDVYYNLALEDFLGVDLENKTVLFAEALDIEKLALIIATARAIEGDKDRNGKTISGSKKLKIVKYIESLRMSAAEKYMLMGYLGYKNKNGETVVRSYINRLNLTKAEKTRLLEYSGYAA